MVRLIANAIALLIVGVSGVCAEPSQYVCTVEHAAGLQYDKQTDLWGPAPFAPGAKYVVRKISEDDRDHQKGKWWPILELKPEDDWAFFEFGKPDPTPLATCSKPRLGDVEFGAQLACHPLAFDATFDTDSRRFEVIVHGGYISQGFWEQYRRECVSHYPS